MSERHRLEELWCRRLAGEPLDPAERAELAGLLSALDPAGREALLDDERLDGWLRAAAIEDRAPADGPEAVARRIAAEAHTDAFVAALRPRLRATVSRRRRVSVAAVATLALSGLAVLWGLRSSPPVPTSPVLTTQAPATVDPPPPPPAPVSPPEPQTRTVRLRFDFESGVVPRFWRASEVVRCPPRPGSRYCLAADRFAPRAAPDVVGVRMEDRRHGLFVVDHGTTIAFDYWLGEEVGGRNATIAVWLHDGTADAPYFARIEGARRGAWMQAELPLEAFRPEHPQRHPARIAPGHRIDFVLFQTSFRKEDVLFLDNVEIADGGPKGDPR